MSKTKYKYGSIIFFSNNGNLKTSKDMKRILDEVQSKIPKDKIYDIKTSSRPYGLEIDPHITLAYGFADEDLPLIGEYIKRNYCRRKNKVCYRELKSI